MELLLAIIQAIGTTFGFFNRALVAQGPLQTAIVIISLTAGTTFLIWIGDTYY